MIYYRKMTPSVDIDTNSPQGCSSTGLFVIVSDIAIFVHPMYKFLYMQCINFCTSDVQKLHLRIY